MPETPAEWRHRVHALVEEWADDPTPISRAEAATLLAERLDPRGWAEVERLWLVPPDQVQGRGRTGQPGTPPASLTTTEDPPMPAEITSRVHLTTHLPDGPVQGEIGTITVPVTDLGISEADVRQQLGQLLQTAGTYLCADGALPSPGVGESPATHLATEETPAGPLS